MRIVPDTNFLVSALIWGGKPFTLLLLATEEEGAARNARLCDLCVKSRMMGGQRPFGIARFPKYR
jgi:hypothetical protein